MIWDLDTIITQWKSDAPVDHTEPGLALLRVPNLHAAYVEQHALHSRELRQCKASLARIRCDMKAYYSGRMTAPEMAKYGLTPFLYNVGRDIESYVDADSRVQTVLLEAGKHEDALALLDKVVKELNNRSFELRGYMDYLRWSNGQN